MSVYGGACIVLCCSRSVDISRHKKSGIKMIPLFYNYLDPVTLGKHEPLEPEHPDYWLMIAIREKLVNQASSMSA